MPIKLFGKTIYLSRPTAGMLLLSSLTFILTFARHFASGLPMYVMLEWNLFLAWVPLFFALIARRTFNSRSVYRQPLTVAWLGLWLLFFPNAPYIITDLVHLSNSYPHLLWFDAIHFFCVALAGLAVGLYSLVVAHGLLNHFFARPMAWLLIAGIVILSSFGLYLGRFVRFNSWDIFTHPVAVLKRSVMELGNPLAIQMTLVFSVVIFIFYLALHVMIPPRTTKSYGQFS